MTPEELANRMVRHIIGESLAAEDECCRKCIAMTREFRNEALEEAAKFVEENYEEPFTNVVGNPSWREKGREKLAAAIRALKDHEPPT